MRPVSGISEILAAERGVAESFERNQTLIPKKISDSWVLMIHLVDAIDSGDYLRAIDYHPVQSGGDLLEYLIDASNNPKVIYEGYVEVDTKYTKGRHPAEESIKRGDFNSTIVALVKTPLNAVKKNI